MKERMELHEANVRRHSYFTFCQSIPDRISKGVEHFFYLLGVNIAKNPIKWMLGCAVIILICLSGLLRFRQEKNPIKLWIPPNADFVSDTEWLMSHFKEGFRTQTFILTSDNVLEPQILIKLNEITKEIISAQTSKKLSWTDVCVKIPVISGYTSRSKRQITLLNNFDDFFDNDIVSKLDDATFEPVIHVNTELYCEILSNLPKACLIFSILDIWNFDSTEIAKDSTEDIITKINTIKISPTLGHAMNFSELLGGVTVDENGRIIAATGIKTALMVHVNFLEVDMDKYGNNAGTADWASEKALEWEWAFLQVIKNISNVLNNEDNENALMLYYEAGRSYGDISGTSMFQDIDKLAIGIVLMFLYVLTIVSNKNWVEWRFCLTATGLFCVGGAFIIAVGICSFIGIPYGPVHTSLPFLLLGLGIDDIFVFMASWKQIHTDELNLNKPLTQKVGLALGHAGSAISVTSLTDVVAFIIGTISIIPSLQSFCIYAAMGVFVTFLLQITFFIGCFTLDVKRIERKRNGVLPCIVHENFAPKSSDPNSAFSWRFINALYSRVILTTPGKIIIVIITITMTCVGIMGSLQLQQWFNPMWLLPKESYLRQYTEQKAEMFSDEGYEAFVIFGDDVDFPSEFSKIISLTENLGNMSAIQHIEPWPTNFAKFVSTYYDTDLTTTVLTHDDFHHYLSKFLVSRAGGKYQRNFVFNETFICGKNAPRIVVATIDFKYTMFKSPNEWIPGMDDSKKIVKEVQINGYVTTWCKIYGVWTTDKLLAQEVLRNILLALVCVMGTTAFLIAELQTCCWILLCVLLTLLNVCGFIYFWGQTIDMTSCIGLELAIGLSVDYAAHVAHAFLNAESQEDDRNARTKRTLIAVRHIGAAVAYGAGSTLIAVSMLVFSTSYIFISFFKIFFLVILFGLWHGLILLPVILSTIGPRSLRMKQSQPMSEKTMNDDED